MEHLLSIWPQIAARLETARHICLFADCDGTLAPIVSKPELATLPPETRQLLEDLSRSSRVTIGIISGRAIADLKDLVGVKGIIYAGNHGMEISGPGIAYRYPLARDTGEILSLLSRVLDQALNVIPGVIIENKELTLSVHYRLVSGDRVQEVKDVFNRSVGGLVAAGKVKITTGKAVLEVRPAVNWHKGKAVQLLMKRVRNNRKPETSLPFYFGDDTTDEDAFRQIRRYNNAMAVFVGEKLPSVGSAGYYLSSTAEVALFLERLLETIRR